MENNFNKIVKRAIDRSNYADDIFDSFIYETINFHDKPAHTISELKQSIKNNKLKGPIFEFFCKKYFEKIIKVENIWLIKECPNDVLTHLGLTKRDYGIDLIILNNGKFSAVQCKFKSPKKLPKKFEMKYHYQNVTWRDLSTFYSLCGRTGPQDDGWDKLIVFTNSQYVGRKGKKNEKDKSICYNTFKNLTIEDFKLLIGEDKINIEDAEEVQIEDELEGEVLKIERKSNVNNKRSRAEKTNTIKRNEKKCNKISELEILQKRLAFFSNSNDNNLNSNIK